MPKPHAFVPSYVTTRNSNRPSAKTTLETLQQKNPNQSAQVEDVLLLLEVDLRDKDAPVHPND